MEKTPLPARLRTHSDSMWSEGFYTTAKAMDEAADLIEATRMDDPFTDPPDTTMTLNPCQSLAMRRLIDTLKRDDAIYSACPEPVRQALADMIMPPYSTAEAQIRALIEANGEGLKLLEKFGARIRDLEKALRAKSKA